MSGLVHVALLYCFTISISACIDRIGQDLVDTGIGGGDPLDLRGGIWLRGKGEVLGAIPEPHLTGQVFVDDFDLRLRPPLVQGSLCQLVLPVSGFAVVRDLRSSRLPYVNIGRTV